MKYLYIILIIKPLNLYPGNCACFTAGAPQVHAPGDARSGYHDTRSRASFSNTESPDGKFTITLRFSVLESSAFRSVCPPPLSP